jgi:hypothetical protein
MDICIPLQSDSPNDYLDLRYALRGFELYVNPEKIYVIGGLPEWIQGVEHIPAKDRSEPHYRERNMFEKLLLCPSEEFLYANDDHYLTYPWLEQYAWDVRLIDKFYSLSRNSKYKMTIANTLRIAPKGNNFDIHCPMVMQRNILQKMRVFRWADPWGLALKSSYALYARISGVQTEDCKFRAPFTAKELKGRSWFSTADGVVEKMVPLFDKLYPKPCKYEKCIGS